ncbi:hypothetical protein [Sphingobacterium detergens]|uniref:hypothetical protein n=1 Tax=Sphingobacterium detergens TaxID=1145106 RepID=UPI00142E672F|nr:hypothetical protein [Sphingobacterium detergens]
MKARPKIGLGFWDIVWDNVKSIIDKVAIDCTNIGLIVLENYIDIKNKFIIINKWTN